MLDFPILPRDNNDNSNCTKATCPINDSEEYSDWAYLPSRAANGFFTGWFGLSIIVFLVFAFVGKRRWLGFSFSMICGSILEVLGYVGRLMSWYDPFSQTGFLMQIVCLTIAPAFYAAGIYLCLAHIIRTFGEDISRIRASWYPRIFITCDFISLVLQAAGGAIASIDSSDDKSSTSGTNIMVAGLAWQVFTLLVFIGLSADYAFRAIRSAKEVGGENAFNHATDALRKQTRFQLFLYALAFATLCIFTRCVYRVAELSEGWKGYLIETESYFIALEGGVVAAAVLALMIWHPAICFREPHLQVSKLERGGDSE